MQRWELSEAGFVAKRHRPEVGGNKALVVADELARRRDERVARRVPHAFGDPRLVQVVPPSLERAKYVLARCELSERDEATSSG